MQWFKFYGEEYLSDPKMLSLSPCERSCWLTLLAYASVASEEGIVKYIDEDTLMRQAGLDPAREEWDETRGVLSKFAKFGMVKRDDNEMITIIHWGERQRKPLTSYERVKRYREKKRGDNGMKLNDNDDNAVEESRVEESRKDIKPFSEKSEKGILTPMIKGYNENEHQEDTSPVFNVDTGEMESDGTEKKPNQNKEWGEFKKYWLKECIKHKAIKAEITPSRDKTIFHAIRKRYSINEMKRIASFFFSDKKSDEHLTVAACFSADTINKWKMKYGRN